MAAPTLKLALSRTGGQRPVPLGQWDLFLPAVNALADGTLCRWPTAIPASYELCRRVDHDCREAAWDGLLAVSGSGAWIDRFSRTMAATDLELVARDYAVLEAAVSVMDLATGLVDAIRNAAVADPGGPALHPLADAEAPDVNMPFGFAVSVARWKGVNPKAFVDFAVGSGSPDAEAFLETVIRQPSKWFKDISALEASLLRLAADRDVEAFRIAVADWNALQDVSIRMPNRDVLVPALWARSEDAVYWGDEFLDSARELVRSLLADRWSWWPEDFVVVR
ncbi:hypothetical protein [Rhizobium sp. BK176]|uniref:hypothetical protein n=1 Tax=Rhizobium sp. BK176 TaxID=2587071 RepID=UPI002169177A|nr:hypothetical protein [Rhizobium sp. BK176]MCS4089875.1 hypothetical protein [Rhizobium sp. BK176]